MLLVVIIHSPGPAWCNQLQLQGVLLQPPTESCFPSDGRLRCRECTPGVMFNIDGKISGLGVNFRFGSGFKIHIKDGLRMRVSGGTALAASIGPIDLCPEEFHYPPPYNDSVYVQHGSLLLHVFHMFSGLSGTWNSFSNNLRCQQGRCNYYRL